MTDTRSGWIGIDLDGTLAHYNGWQGVEHIGAPIPAMLERVKEWLAAGTEVRIFTARIGFPDAAEPIWLWLETQGLPRLTITNVKDSNMIELWDDRAVRVETNTGRVIS